MTPPVFRSSLSSARLCTPSSIPTTIVRAFSTTIRCSIIGPESPRFIEVPQPPQQRARAAPIIRGKLPPPRDVFASRGGKDKTTKKYIRETIPKPARGKRPPRSEQEAWKRRMADTRRRNFQEGLKALRERKIRKEADLEKESRDKTEWRDERAYAPPRADQVYTSSTVREVTKWLQRGPLPDPDREARVAAAAARVQAKEAEREAARRDALHSLYMHARFFITTEEQLNEEIENLFQPKPFQNAAFGTWHDNIWDAESSPPSVQDMLQKINGNEGTTQEFYKGPGALIGSRMQKIAEEMTGGKMD